MNSKVPPPFGTCPPASWLVSFLLRPLVVASQSRLLLISLFQPTKKLKSAPSNLKKRAIQGALSIGLRPEKARFTLSDVYWPLESDLWTQNPANNQLFNIPPHPHLKYGMTTLEENSLVLPFCVASATHDPTG